MTRDKRQETRDRRQETEKTKGRDEGERERGKRQRDEREDLLLLPMYQLSGIVSIKGVGGGMSLKPTLRG